MEFGRVMFFTKAQGERLEDEVAAIRQIVDELVKSRLKIEFFIKGAVLMYAAEYFGLKEVALAVIESGAFLK